MSHAYPIHRIEFIWDGFYLSALKRIKCFDRKGFPWNLPRPHNAAWISNLHIRTRITEYSSISSERIKKFNWNSAFYRLTWKDAPPPSTKASGVSKASTTSLLLRRHCQLVYMKSSCRGRRVCRLLVDKIRTWLHWNLFYPRLSHLQISRRYVSKLFFPRWKRLICGPGSFRRCHGVAVGVHTCRAGHCPWGMLVQLGLISLV